MGQEISDSEFDEAAFAEFRRRVGQETRLLATWLEQGRLASTRRRFGFEIEGWLVDDHARPSARNQEFLAAAADPMVVAELSRFNFEINSEPLELQGGALDAMYEALQRCWHRCTLAAAGFGVRPLLVGILPTVSNSDLNIANMSPLQRYRAINDQVFRLRHGAPIEIDIDGVEHLHHVQHDVMLEAGTTSLQIHVQTDAAEAARAFNTCKMLSAITVGAGANSPYLFGRRLWQETRIALFEQAVAVGGSEYSNRVTFGIRYAHDSILECFEANLVRYPVILPDLMDVPAERLAHLRLHNGTVWRWNRPLIGFDDDGNPHIRIEHRVIAAGPTPCDAIANMALFLGLFESLMRSDGSLESAMPFERARDNFYAAARHGFDAQIAWMGLPPMPLHELLERHLLRQAAAGLEAAGFGDDETERWIGIISERTARRQTGADWQAAWIDRHGRDFNALVEAYAAEQSQDRPVHQWSLN